MTVIQNMRCMRCSEHNTDHALTPDEVRKEHPDD